VFLSCHKIVLFKIRFPAAFATGICHWEILLLGKRICRILRGKKKAGLLIAPGDTLKKVVDFSMGELAVKVTRNGGA